MASRHREEKAIAATDCPDCGARIGEPCRHPTADAIGLTAAGRLMVCRGRLRAWQMIRDGDIRDETPR